MTFIAVIRLIPIWFAPGRVPLLTQLTGMSGQLGQLFSVVPFAMILHLAGWTPAFLTLTAMSVLAVVSCWSCSRTGRPGTRHRNRRKGCAPPGSPSPTPGGSPAPGWGSGATSRSSSAARSSR